MFEERRVEGFWCDDHRQMIMITIIIISEYYMTETIIIPDTLSAYLVLPSTLPINIIITILMTKKLR